MYIQSLNEISREDDNLVGGKAASLGELTKANFPVPAGFVITVEGMGKINKDEILQAFNALNAKRVAVRSSAVAEDSLQASWAGQLETYLNVSREDLIAKIKDCWNSIKSERAQSYAARQNLSEEQLLVAVVVQKMVDSKVSGVMFTANPVTNNRKEIVIESVEGLGEALVQGLVTPDNFVVDKKSLEIKQGDSQDETAELAKMGKAIENHFGSPQDIEWAIDKEGKIWILQSRPITTL